MKFWAGLIAGLVTGVAAGYFAAKKKFDKQLKTSAEKLETQYQERLKKELADAKKVSDNERDKAVKETEAHAKEHEKEAIVAALKRVEAEDKDVNSGVDVAALADEEDDILIEGWDPGNGSEFDDPEAEWDAYMESISEYIGTARPYNITEAMFSETKINYQKRKLYLCVDENQDYAYDAETGNVVENYHMLIGDEEYDTLIPQRCDNAAWYVRNDREETDYMIQYQNSALLH